MSALTKDDLIELVRDKSGFPAKESRNLVEMILEEVKVNLEEGREVKVSGFGKWLVKEKKRVRDGIPIQVKKSKSLPDGWFLFTLLTSSVIL